MRRRRHAAHGERGARIRCGRPGRSARQRWSGSLGDPRALGRAALNAYEPYPIMDVHLWHDGAQHRLRVRGGRSIRRCNGSSKGARLSVLQHQRGRRTRLHDADDEMVERAWARSCAASTGARRCAACCAAPRRATRKARTWPRRVRIAPGPRTSLPNVAVAGAWTATGWPDTMESAVRSGIAAARTLLQAQKNTGARGGSALTHA